MTMTGARIKDILEDVADNLFNPDPYYQQGGDMVRAGGISYTIDVGEKIGQRISDLKLLRTGKPLEPATRIHRRRLGERERRHAGAADLGPGDGAYCEEKDGCAARWRPRARCGHLKKICPNICKFLHN